jgi:hypothetical protein
MLVTVGGAGVAQSVGGISVPSVGGLGGGGTSGSGGALGGLGGLPGGGIPGTLGGTLNDLVNSVNNSSGGGPQMVAGRFVDNMADRVEITRKDIETELESNLDSLQWGAWVREVPPATLLDLRKLRLEQLVKESGGRLEFDGAGNPTVRGRLIALDPTRAALSAARKAGFTVIATERDPVLGTSIVVLNIPRGLTTPAAMALIRRASPTINVEFDHIFEPAGGALAATSIALAASTANVAAGGRPLIGIIDGGVAQNPALATASIEQKGFAGAPQATGHGTAVASLIVGSNGKFRGAAPSAALLVGDVYGGNPAAGSALAVVKAMSWIAAQRPGVINVSLVGPRNRVVERAVGAVQARGIKVVAAVGNDGPAAPPQYPASQPGVIAVTGVDATNRALAEAGRPLHLDYSAPGADMAAALPGKGYANVRGTSFAAPLVSARLALTGSTQRLDAEASKKGFGRIGRGIVCGPCRVAPKQVGAK